MTNREQALIGSLLINTLFQHYDVGELNGVGELIRSRNATFVRKNKDTKEFLEWVRKCHTAWEKTIDEFEDLKMPIEAKTTIMILYNYFEGGLKRYALITPKHIEKFMMMGTNNVEAELNSTKVVNFLVGLLGVERELTFKEKLALKNNLK